MKTGNRSILAILPLSLALTLSAAEKKVGGPKGGRLLENERRQLI